MEVSLIVTSVDDPDSNWQKEFKNSDQFRPVQEEMMGRKFVGILPGAFVPVRTNNCGRFAQDFFLPTVINHAIHVKNVVVKIFAILGALVLDVLTFISRILTCIPRAIINAKQKETPFHTYLRNENVGSRLLASESVLVSTMTWLPGTSEQVTSRMHIPFIDVPSPNHTLLSSTQYKDLTPE